jgi:hypothetical protein
MFSTKKTKALSSAQKTLEARGKISAAIHEEETRLGALVIERVKAEQLLSVAEAGAALDEPGADVSGAESGLAKAKTAIDKSSAKLAALRGRLVLMAGELATARSAVKGELPAHVEALKTDFAVEWTKGIEAFGQLMGKRAALEARIGKIEMKAPSAAAIELPEEINAPWNVIRNRRLGALRVSAGGRRNGGPFQAVRSHGGVRGGQSVFRFRAWHAIG